MFTIIRVITLSVALLAFTSSFAEVLLIPNRHFTPLFLFHMLVYGLIIFLLKKAFTKTELRKLVTKTTYSHYPAYVYLIALSSFTVSSYLCYTEIISRDIWLDEATQFTWSAFLSSWKNTSEFAVMQQQTPLDYQFSFIFGQLFGHQAFAVRLSAIIFSTLSTLFLPFLVYTLFPNALSVAVAVVFYLGNPFIIYYSAEGRPIQLTVFWSLIYLFFTLECIIHKRLKDFKLYLSIALIFILTTGLQPIWLCLSLGLITLIFLIGQKTLFKKILWVHALTAIAVLPSVAAIYIKGLPQNQFFLNRADQISKYIKNFDPIRFDFYLLGYDPLLPFFYALLILSFVSIALKRKIPIASLVLPLSILFFVLSVDVFFTTTINWNFHARYILVLVSLVVFFAASLASSIESIINPRVKMAVAIVFLFITCPYIIIRNSKERPPELNDSYNHLSFNADIYRELEHILEPKDIVVRLDLVSYDSWRPNFFESQEFYLPQSKYPQLQEADSNLNFGFKNKLSIPYFALNNDSSFRLFLVNHYPPKDTDLLRTWQSKGLKPKLYDFGRNKMFQFNIDSNSGRDTIYRIFHALEEQVPKRYLGVVYEHLIYYAYKDKNLKDLQSAFQKLISIKNHIPPDPTGNNFERKNHYNLVKHYKSVINDFSLKSRQNFK